MMWQGFVLDHAVALEIARFSKVLKWGLRRGWIRITDLISALKKIVTFNGFVQITK